MHLCYELPAPACHIYRDMKTRRMQQVLAQRALLEKELRAHLSELVFHQQQIKGWLNTVSVALSVCAWITYVQACWYLWTATHLCSRKLLPVVASTGRAGKSFSMGCCR